MSIEIKFRAWYPSVKKMRHFSNGMIIADGEFRYGMFFQCEEGSVYLGGCKVMQYTGLKDRNEKEIYAGDVIEGGYLNPLTNEFNSKKYIVEYSKACFNGKLIGHSPYGDTWLHFISGEVIGNIYENPELLEV